MNHALFIEEFVLAVIDLSRLFENQGAVFAAGRTECFGGNKVTPKVWLNTGVFLPHGEPDRPEGSTAEGRCQPAAAQKLKCFLKIVRDARCPHQKRYLILFYCYAP